jgi:hypothetical protein
MSKPLKEFVVLYRDPDMHFLLDAPLVFICAAEDIDHADEQCEDANPGCEVLWAHEGADIDAAFEAYYQEDEA